VRSFSVPALANNTGYWVTLQLTSSSLITAGWSIAPEQVGGQIQLYLYAGNPFSGQPNPSILAPPANPLVSDSTSSNQSNAVGIVSPQVEPAGTYSVYFFKVGNALDQATNGVLGYASGNCT